MMLKEKQMSQWSIEWLYGGSTFPLNLLSVNAYQSRYLNIRIQIKQSDDDE